VNPKLKRRNFRYAEAESICGKLYKKGTEESEFSDPSVPFILEHIQIL